MPAYAANNSCDKVWQAVLAHSMSTFVVIFLVSRVSPKTIQYYRLGLQWFPGDA